MRNILSIGLLAGTLSGCIATGPMALLPPAAKYLLWDSNEKQNVNGAKSISVQDLLQNAREFSTEAKAPAKMHIPYNDYVLNDARIAEVAKFKTKRLELVCGPYEFGTPIEAATTALRNCSAIKKQLTDHGLEIDVRFNPDGEKGQAVISPILIIEAKDA